MRACLRPPCAPISTSNMNPSTLRWGILSTARIVRKNWQGMRDSGAATLVALASRDLEKARAFIDGIQAEFPWPEKPTALGSYQDLLDSPDIGAVYIPLPTGVRKEWVMRAASTGKHVLCEKPCAVSATELREMLACCEENNVLFMDGVMFMHDPRYVRLREILDDDVSVGPLKRLTSVFSFGGSEDFAKTDIRGQVGLEPTGCLGDLGWYCLRGMLWAMNWELPTQVTGRILTEIANGGGESAIMEFSAELDFPNGVTGAFYCSFLAPNQMWLNLSGTAGYLRIPDFVVPATGNDVDWETNYLRQPRAIATRSIEANMFARFAADATAGALDPRWAEIALKTQILLDACLLSGRTNRVVTLETPPSAETT